MSYKYRIPPYKNSMNNSLENLKEKVSNIFNNKTANNVKKNLEKNIDIVYDFSAKHVLLLFLILIVMILIYVLLNYVLTDCYQKKSLGQYLLDFDLQPCIHKYKPSSYKERKKEEEREVFHIANQDYTYEQAKCKCKAYSGHLATKQEIIEAYNKGADWCTYGWSEGQTAYYPTQKCTRDKLQEGDPKHRYDCGLPGVNGGFFSNPKLKFGINCYGIKPKGRIVKEKAPVCEGRDFCKMRNNYNSAHRLDTDKIAPFNNDQWSVFG